MLTIEDLIINNIGETLCNEIDKTKINLSGNQDGRIESLLCESEITNCIRKKCTQYNFLDKGCNRSFGDITLVLNNIAYPINIKMVDPKKTPVFNGGGPKTFNYVLFGSEKKISWDNLAKKIITKKPLRCVKEYYYLIYYKNSPLKSVFCSLGNIHPDSITANPSNPIQLKKKIKTIQRTPEEQAKFIINLFTECARKRAEAYKILTTNTE